MIRAVNPGSTRTPGENAADAILEAALAKTNALRGRKLAERIFDRVMLSITDAKTVAEREARARTHANYLSADDVAFDAESKAILAKAAADAAEILFAEWQSRNATARAEMQLR